MKWTDYEFPAWVIPQIKEKIIAANSEFEVWAKAARDLGIFAVAESAGFDTSDRYVKGNFIYYKDNLGYIRDIHTYWHEVTVIKKIVLRPQMLKYQLTTKTSQAKLANIFSMLIKLNGRLLSSTKFVSTAQILIEIPIGTIAEFEETCKVKLHSIPKVHVN